MNNLLKEIEHELIALNGCFVTDKDLAFWNETDKQNQNYWRIDNNVLILKLEKYIKEIKNDAHKNCQRILVEMNNLNVEMRNMQNPSEIYHMYYDNKMALLIMPFCCHNTYGHFLKDLALLEIEKD